MICNVSVSCNCLIVTPADYLAGVTIARTLVVFLCVTPVTPHSWCHTFDTLKVYLTRFFFVTPAKLVSQSQASALCLFVCVTPHSWCHIFGTLKVYLTRVYFCDTRNWCHIQFLVFWLLVCVTPYSRCLISETLKVHFTHIFVTPLNQTS